MKKYFVALVLLGVMAFPKAKEAFKMLSDK